MLQLIPPLPLLSMVKKEKIQQAEQNEEQKSMSQVWLNLIFSNKHLNIKK
jgi:hypothetical protein